MKKLLSILIVTVAASVAIPTTILAADEKPEAPQGGRRSLDPEARLKQMTEQLGLNAEQQGKIKAIFEKNAAPLKEIMAKSREDRTDEDRTKMRELMTKQNEEISAVLTPEQKEKMKELRAARGGQRNRGGDSK